MASSSEVPARPGQLTTEFLQQILRPLYPSHHVVDYDWKPMNLGVIAEVVTISVEFEPAVGSGDTAKLQRRFVGKFLRPEFPFESMFAVESKFYNEFTTKAGDAAMKNSAAVVGFPFAIPTAIFTSNVLIVLECVESVKTFTCVDGSPPHHIPMLVTKLAQMHARFWNYDCDGLSTPAGIGGQLTGEEKRLQFPGCWEDYLDDVVLGSKEKAQLTELCQRLSGKPDQLEAVHDLVESGPATLIHGDFHIANMLLPTDPADKTTWLLDWATCGKGNPLRDLAFFFIVSVQASHRQAQEAQCLEVYHKALTAEAEAARLSLDELHQQYKACVLNQFVILVVYDSLSKSLAANAKTERLRVELDAHFREVNRRACLSVLDNVGEKDLELLLARCT
ncbi:aminoglycoside phosphotransferase [Phytophthora cinnamomi]|uniref:aminoglycoside phosphotransferase n=1 Tax=Phytophthora cinnamomi TaxID=4785 RepID=UPI00355AC3F5|nr:aminoglycoside phosphotransferase [Phytophthora cinnamomi]